LTTKSPMNNSSTIPMSFLLNPSSIHRPCSAQDRQWRHAAPIARLPSFALPTGK
jgi:hypothetical protein